VAVSVAAQIWAILVASPQEINKAPPANIGISAVALAVAAESLVILIKHLLVPKLVRRRLPPPEVGSAVFPDVEVTLIVTVPA